MVEYRATLTLVPTFPPRRTENFPGNFPSSGEAELLDEAEELARVKQIKEDTRELVFTPEKKTFQIGRASSNPHKGLMAARDNAFFLSPVMSRYHAEVQMIEKKKQIQIRDTDSMHGTYVNGKAIWGQEWQSLNSGDALTFGAQVSREGEVFMPKDFTCDVVWDKIEFSPTTPEATNNKSDRRISGYGVSSEDLIISDDDTESVDFDKTSIEYHCYSEEEEYSDDSEQDDSDYEKENTDVIGAEENFPTSSVRNEKPKYENETKEPPTMDSTPLGVRLPSVKSLVPDATPARGKFSIGSLMNDTLEALSSKRCVDGNDVETTNSGNEVQAKGDTKDGPSKPSIDNDSEDQQVQPSISEETSTSSSGIAKVKSTIKQTAPTLFIEVDSESDSDEAPEELDTKGRVPWKHLSIPPTPPRETEKPLEKPSYNQQPNTPVLVKPVFQTATPCAPSPGTATKSYSTTEVKPSDIFDAAKLDEWKKQGASTLATGSGGTCGLRGVTSPLQKDEFFAAMRDNQTTLVNMMRERWTVPQPPTPFIPTTTREASETLQPAPLPWVHGSFAPTHLASSPQQLSISTKASNTHNTSTANQSTPQNTRKPHLFEQLLLSEEAKARTEKLEKLKAIYNHRGKRDVTFNPWTMEGDEPLEGSLFADEGADMALDEAAHNLFGSRSRPVPVADPYLMHRVEKAKPRGFAISTLVDDQPATTNALKSAPVYRHWVAEKVSTENRENNEDSVMADAPPPLKASVSSSSVKSREILSHISPPHGTKRKYDETMYEDLTEDKIVQEPAPIEEKIAELSVEAPIVNVDVKMGGVSEEKESYEEVVPVGPVIPNEAVLKVEETPRQAEPLQPPPKRARVFTTGFALGAVTGAVGLFAALVASAP